jgi:hypothetical protein
VRSSLCAVSAWWRGRAAAGRQTWEGSASPTFSWQGMLSKQDGFGFNRPTSSALGHSCRSASVHKSELFTRHRRSPSSETGSAHGSGKTARSWGNPCKTWHPVSTALCQQGSGPHRQSPWRCPGGSGHATSQGACRCKQSSIISISGTQSGMWSSVTSKTESSGGGRLTGATPPNRPISCYTPDHADSPVTVSRALLKIKIFLWLAFRRRHWTADRRRCHGLEHDEHCYLCDQVEESIDHIVANCPFTTEVWFLVLQALGL